MIEAFEAIVRKILAEDEINHFHDNDVLDFSDIPPSYIDYALHIFGVDLIKPLKDDVEKKLTPERIILFIKLWSLTCSEEELKKDIEVNYPLYKGMDSGKNITKEQLIKEGWTAFNVSRDLLGEKEIMYKAMDKITQINDTLKASVGVIQLELENMKYASFQELSADENASNHKLH